MKQVFLSGQGQVEVFDVPVPGRLAGAALVRNACSLISSGTEGAAVTTRAGLLGLYEKVASSKDRIDQVWQMVKSQGVGRTFDLVKNRLSDFTPLGYGSAGVVVEVDSYGVGFEPGQRVACMGTGFANHAEYVVVPKHLLAPIPDSVSLEEACFGALACIGMQGLRRLELTPGESIGVVGLGLIGQLALRLASAMGYSVVGIDIDEQRVLKARESGARALQAFGPEITEAVRNANGGRGLDGVVICASSKDDAVVNQAFDMCRKRGRVSIVGDVGLGLNRARMYAKELELRLSCSYGIGRHDPAYEISGQDYPVELARWTENRNLRYFCDLLARGLISTRELLTQRVPVDQAKRAYGLVKTGNSAIFGVALDYGLAERTAAARVETIIKHKEARHSSSAGDVVRLGLIGVGAYAKNVHVPNIGRIEGLHVRAVASRTGGSAAVVARRVGAAYSTSDYQRVLDDHEIDAVLISTRHSSHGRIAADSLRAGKHVFIEKPMATTIEDCALICRLATEHNRIVRVGFNRRFAPHLVAMKRAVPTSSPRLLTVRVNVGPVADHWSNTTEEGGRLLGEGAHFFDLANWILDAKPLRVKAEFIGDASFANPNALVCLGFADGSAAVIAYTALGNTGRGKEYFELFGAGKTVVVDDFNDFQAYGVQTRSRRDARGDKGQAGVIENFCNAIRKGTGPDEGADALAGFRATAIAVASVASAREGKEIRLDDYLVSENLEGAA